MSSKLFLTVTAALCGMSAAFLPLPVRAEVALRSAEIREIIRQVRLQPKNQGMRDAVVRDKMLPEDALWTSKRSRAGLRFNDGSYARVGELALFRFTPGTRNFQLNNGTVLLLIKPGQGRTRIDTPNASAGVRGSALFVRYDDKTKTTVVGALTNNPQGPMEVTAANGQTQALKAGEIAIVDQTGFIRRYKFDIPTFYDTSDMVRGLDLPRREPQANPDPAIAAVQRETAEALKQQKPLDPIATIENPSNTKLSASPTPLFNNGDLKSVAQTNVPQPAVETVGKTNPPEAPQSDTTPTDSRTTKPTDRAKPNSEQPPTSQPSSTTAPATSEPTPTTAPATSQPSSTTTPATSQPSSTTTPATSQPSSTTTPATSQPSSTTAPATSQPTPTTAPTTSPVPTAPELQPTQTPSRPPIESTGSGPAAQKENPSSPTTPPATTPPATTPPITTPPATTPPITAPPITAPPITTPPITTPPITTPPITTPPITTPPITTPPITTPPITAPPITIPGAGSTNPAGNTPGGPNAGTTNPGGNTPGGPSNAPDPGTTNPGGNIPGAGNPSAGGATPSAGGATPSAGGTNPGGNTPGGPNAGTTNPGGNTPGGPSNAPNAGNGSAAPNLQPTQATP